MSIKLLLEQLVDVGSGKLQHIQNGGCPNPGDVDELRDELCPACAVLLRAEHSIAAQAPSISDAMGAKIFYQVAPHCVFGTRKRLTLQVVGVEALISIDGGLHDSWLNLPHRELAHLAAGLIKAENAIERTEL